MEKSPEAPWVGWVRKEGKGNPWKAIVEGDTWEQCWDRLLGERPGAHVEKIVLEKGRRP